MALSAKHQQFINEYLQCWNATEAYMRVYECSYATANSNGPKLLVNTSISEALQKRIDENAMTADEVLARLAKQARGTMRKFVNVSPSGDSFTLDLTDDETGKLDIVRKITKTTRRFGDTEIEEATIDLYDAQSALVHLGKHLDLFSDKVTVKLEKELKSALDALEKSLDSDTYSQVLAVLAGKLSSTATEGD